MGTNLVQVKENETITTSLLVAEKFSKNHKNVITKIETLIADIETGLILSPLNLFKKSEYRDAHNQLRPMYYMNRDGFTLLAMGFTGKEALQWKLKYIEAFNEMEKRLVSPVIQDNRIELAKIMSRAKDFKVVDIRPLFPEYFPAESEIGTLEHEVELNTSYMRWKDDNGINKDWIGYFPTIDIYHHYARYCVENKLLSMGKKSFYQTLEYDFNLTRRQKANGLRYFISA